MQVNPCLTFNGNCEEAFKAYHGIFGGDIVAMIPHEERRPKATCRPNGVRRSSMPASSATAWCWWAPTRRLPIRARITSKAGDRRSKVSLALDPSRQ